MPTTDPIADMLTRVRNANKSLHEQVDVPASKMKERIAKVLKREGFIKDYQMIQAGVQGVLRIQGFMAEHLNEGFANLDEAADAIARYLPNRKRPSSLAGLAKNLRLGADGRHYWHWDPLFMTGERNINAGALEILGQMMDALPKLDVPVLLVRGMQSELIHPHHAEEFLALAPKARLVDVSEAGHMVAGDRNDVFTEAVLGFLGEVRG